MEKPKVFIGSSVEGLKIAEAVFANMNYETEPTLWKNDIFLPSEYPLETLEQQLKLHSFAILVASPDDILIKRGETSQAMRDNILFEFGLFSGVLGRRRTFLLLPENKDIAIPSDLLGIIPARYDENRLKKDPPEYAAAVQVACNQIRQVIRNEWSRIPSKKRLSHTRQNIGRTISLIASILTIFIFLTGINNLPTLLNLSSFNQNKGLFNLQIATSISVSVFVVSQIAYYLSYYSILRFIHIYLFSDRTFWVNDFKEEPHAIFFSITLFLLGCGISYLFLEAYWGNGIVLIKEGRLVPVFAFCTISIAMNLLTVWTALRCHWL